MRYVSTYVHILVACQNAGSDKFIQLTIGTNPSWHSMVVSPWVSPWLSPVRPAQQFLDGEKLVDGMLRRVRSAAMQAGRDPDERRGSTVEPWRFHQLRWTSHLWIPMGQNGEWVDDGSNLSINSYCQVIILIISYLFLDLLFTRPRSISSQRQHQVPISSPGSTTHGQAHAAHRREPQIHPARGVCSHFSGIYIYIGIIYLIIIIYIYIYLHTYIHTYTHTHIYIYIIFDNYMIYI